MTVDCAICLEATSITKEKTLFVKGLKRRDFKMSARVSSKMYKKMDFRRGQRNNVSVLSSTDKTERELRILQFHSVVSVKKGDHYHRVFLGQVYIL